MAASEELARRVVEAGRSCSLTTAVLKEWSRLGTPKQVEYLAGYLEAERSSREASKRATLLRRCALPAPKTFDGYDWSAVSWPEGVGRESLLALDFVGRREDLVLMGDVGTGKTQHGVGPLRAGVREEARGALLHGVLARDAPEARPRRREARPGGRAYRQGPPARHRRARVSPARRGRGEAALPGPRRRIREAVGGIHHEPGVQQVWAVFGDDQMAAALIDRIVHHGRLVQFRGESHRVRHALMQEG